VCYVILTAKEELQSASCAAIKKKESDWQHPGSSWQKIDTRELAPGSKRRPVAWQQVVTTRTQYRGLPNT